MPPNRRSQGPPPLPTSPPARQSKRPKKASSRAQAIAEDSQPGPSNSQPSAATPAPRPEGPHAKAARERAALEDISLRALVGPSFQLEGKTKHCSRALANYEGYLFHLSYSQGLRLRGGDRCLVLVWLLVAT